MEAEIMAGRNGRVGFSPPLQTAFNALSGFRRHRPPVLIWRQIPRQKNNPERV
ncbi:hypothetical protein [Neisseria lactamica]|uniref:hypothetical protein n=1 Tax=Neisseria lactamica TaxID=486 RepID=UPI00130442A5|nr:hypothetical protein [Neisseria lactamica]